MQNLQEIPQTPNLPPPAVSEEEIGRQTWAEIIEKLPSDAHLRFFGRSWADYENLLEAAPEASGLRINYTEGILEIMTLSSEHESYVRLLERMIGNFIVRRRVEILSFGSATIKKSRLMQGAEPDACFYVQTAAQIGNRIQLDFSVDPPPDVVVEIDLHHESTYKIPIYAALGVSEIWRYDGEKLEILKLTGGEYIQKDRSDALPILSAAVLTDFLNRTRTESQPKILFAFEDWLKAQK